ncbi:MSHA biogenesis protein MshQ [Photobacterium leiognathi lrivu.4.1]|uniref:MSHA biogenesis protein MshQ n=2 Tax=Photobacterium leiognathi TaxID=553611 RepID=A0A0U1P975_PHOLE|nr:MSHA biogenesis protein MshQ [Photobacterium leiognathi lrivu.4.1]
MKACFQAVLLFLFSTLIAFQVNAGEYEFGSFDTSVCSSLIVAESEDSYDDESGCKITFKKTFATRPLVFLMPTIPSINTDDDAPQTLSLLNVTKSSFSVAQVVAPLAKKNSSLQKNQMATISYLAIEAGITEFDDGHKVFAGSISTKRFVSDGNQSNPAYEYINLTTKASFITQSPIVLSEVQGRKNKRWLTTAVTNLSQQGFNIGLELTRVNKKEPDIDSKERVGFLISQPHAGETLGYDYEFSFGDIISNSGKDYPLQHVCNSEVGFSHKKYSTVPNVIAGKLTRKGGQGGWLRRCALTDKGVSFVIDEDIPENTAISSRRHTDEKVGFLAFADKPMLPPVTDDECKYFLGPAQTWEGRHLPLLQIGQSSRLINTYESENKRYVGFNQKHIFNNLEKGCDDDKCNASESLIVKLENKPQLPQFEENKSSNTFDAGKLIEPEIPYSQYKSLSARGGSITLDKDMKIETLSLDSNSKLTLKTGTYWIDSFIVNGSRIVIPENNKVVIYTRGYSFNHTSGTNGALINIDGSPDNLVIYAYNEPPTSSLLFKTYNAISNASIIKALIYSEKKTYLSNDAIVYGSVTINQIELINKSKIIGESECFNPKPDNYILEIEPEMAFSLTCDYLPVTFRVKKEDGTLADTYSGSVSITTNITEVGKASWFPTDSDTPYKDVSEEASVNIVNGIGQLRLKSHGYIGNIAVTGQLDNSPSTNIVKGNYTFVPFKFGFEPSPVKVIAGKPTAVKIKALACENDEATVATGYSGNKRLSISSAFLQPSTKGNGDLELKALSSDWQNQQETFSFLNGVAEFSFRYPDAGIVDLKLTDLNCSVSNGCDILPSDTLPKSFADWTQLEGSVEVHARPWTFAVCPQNKDGEYVKADGTSSSGEGFVAAGDKFDVDVKPIVWRSAGSETADINSLYSNSIDLCESVITPNFFKAGAPAARVELSIPSDHSITPVNGKPGELQGITVKEHTETLTYADLSWSEVGSVRLQADAKAPYLAMTINQGYRHLGRFYPKFLELQPNSFTYPDGHNESAYLSQPFNADLMLKAKNALGEQVENYNGFVSDFQAEVSLMAYEYPSLNSLNDRFSYHHITRSTDQSFKGLWNSDIEQVWLLERKSVTKTPLTTVEDGPWNDSNSRWGGYISSYHDPIFIRNTTTDVTDDVDSKQVAHFETTPNLHYGRMVLSDAIGLFDKPVTIPLKIEHWNGTEFVTHDDDSGSKYNSNYFCKVALHPTGAENESILTANKIDNVTLGKSDKIEAHPNLSKPDDYKKQQTRFWLRIANDAPVDIGCSQDNKEYQPWLTYNWRELGDEDPSAVVTFGVYRGNERIVYRGEKGLN